jgi:hypothetical protein
LLRQALEEPDKLATFISEFQRCVWNESVAYPSQAIEEAIRDLAYDLDYYEADPRIRAEDRSFFGEERALTEIRSALAVVEATRTGA